LPCPHRAMYSRHLTRWLFLSRMLFFPLFPLSFCHRSWSPEEIGTPFFPPSVRGNLLPPLFPHCPRTEFVGAASFSRKPQGQLLETLLFLPYSQPKTRELKAVLQDSSPLLIKFPLSLPVSGLTYPPPPFPVDFPGYSPLLPCPSPLPSPKLLDLVVGFSVFFPFSHSQFPSSDGRTVFFHNVRSPPLEFSAGDLLTLSSPIGLYLLIFLLSPPPFPPPKSMTSLRRLFPRS